MAFGDVGKVCLFSEISGVITLDGKPVAHAKLVRTVKKEKAVTDETTTDAHGYFKMPAIYDRTITKYLPMEFVVKQDITLYYNNKEYKLWDGVKRTEEENAESRGKPLIVKCELNSEVNHISVNGSVFFNLCTWDVVPDQKREYKTYFDQETD
ncbi:MAG: carboxypeptidase regulatory-like domain-containing protein [Gammaproteobacteria bacterium]|nr:carboxypeptidase regulatory-like domain-containing protein [Gammaproteobacteria bacterium]